MPKYAVDQLVKQNDMTLMKIQCVGSLLSYCDTQFNSVYLHCAKSQQKSSQRIEQNHSYIKIIS